MKALVERWSAIIGERFQPGVYVPMILLFTAGNGIYLTTAESRSWSWMHFGAAFVLLFWYFLRLRVFDELKDYETDLVINPHRPLARGAASFRQVKRGLFVLIVLELILTWNLGVWPFLAHLVAIFYSLMMFEEFFLSDHLRPHLTLYAVTHTFSSVLVGLSAAIAMTGMDLRNLHMYHVYFFLTNWAFFNIFEFARKTFAPEEERENVESYSKIYGVTLAVGLTISQALVGNWLIYKAIQNPMLYHLHNRLWWTVGACALYILTCIPFVLKPTRFTGKTFRLISSFYLLLHYVLVILLFAWK